MEHLSGTGSGPHRLTRDGSDGQNMSIYIDELQADSTGLVNGNNTSGSNSTTLPFGISVSLTHLNDSNCILANLN